MHRFFRIYLAAVFLGSSLLTSCVTSQKTKPSHHTAIPPRDESAPRGSQFIESLHSMSAGDREKAILSEFRKGNIPDHLRELSAIKFTTKKNNKTYDSLLWVMPDYLTIGDNHDYVRLPMNPITAQRIADHYGFLLPTKKIVDLIYQNAQHKLKPITFRPSSRMVHSTQWLEHHRGIENQLKGASAGEMIAGHKKDVVLSNRLLRKKGRVAIYGWHRLNGKAIQPLSTVHGHHYSDYSHGVRLVANMMLINGSWHPVADVLQDPQLSIILSDEGPLKQIRYQTEGVSIDKNWLSSLGSKPLK